jgi:siroheme decarboxylase
MSSVSDEVQVSVNELDEVDRRLVDRLQSELGVVERPFATVGEDIGVSEAEVLERAQRLRDSGLIRQTSAIFDTRKLGYTSALVAAMLPPEQLESGAAVVSAHPGVSHNYEREHAFNLWFTLAIPPGESFDSALEDLKTRAGFLKCRPLPSLKVFRIGVRFQTSAKSEGTPSVVRKHGHGASTGPLPDLTDDDKAAIRALQEDLPIVSKPYDAISASLGLSIEQLAAWSELMREQGRLRRISAVLRHRQAGFKANAMVVWNVNGGDVQEMGEFCADIDEVSHCYERPTFDDWPYALYTMIHGKEPADCDRVIQQVVDRFGDMDRAILYSTREFKKERVKYFV